MIARLFAALDVDYVQWRAITKTALLVDLRTSTFVRGPQGQQVKAIAALIGQLLFYTVTGAFISAFVIFAGDLFLAASMVLAYVMFMVGTAALLDHNAAITSPDDYYILGFRPVTSRTYFAARIANILVYTSVMTTMFAYLPIGAFFFRSGAAVGFAAVAAIYGSSIFMAFAMVAVYAWLLRRVGARRIKRALSYFQFVFSFLVYGGFFLVSRVLSRNLLASLALPKTVWLLIVPSSWFASYVDLAAGRQTMLEIVPALVSVAAIAGLAVFLGGRLSLDYAERLGAIAAATSAQTAARPVKERLGFWFRSGESRAVAILIRSQFANDMKFRMSVLAILPLTIIYLAMGISSEGTLSDPFKGDDPSQGLGMITLAMMMFPGMLKMSLGRSDAFRASWIFFACPADRTRLVRAAKNVLVVTFILPYLLFVALAVAYFSENVLHLLIHLSVIGLLSHLVLQVTTFVVPELPFSKPITKGRSSTRVFLLSMLVAVGAVFFPLLAPVLYRSTWTIVCTFAIVIAVTAAMERLTWIRVQRQTATLEFEG